MTTHYANFKPEMHVKPLTAGATVLVLPTAIQPGKRWGEAAGYLLQCECRYKPGDTITGRETWRLCGDEFSSSVPSKIQYKADGHKQQCRETVSQCTNLAWRSSAAMPSDLSRWRLKVKSVRAVKLAALRVPDMRKMGKPSVWVDEVGGRSKRTLQQWTCKAYLKGLRSQWEQDYPKLPFDTAWVWRMEVER